MLPIVKQWPLSPLKKPLVNDVRYTDVKNKPTLNVLRFVDASHVLQNVVVEGLGQLCRHGRVEVRLVAFQYALQCELTHTQDLVVQIHDVFAPRTTILICKQPQIQDFAYSKKRRKKRETKSKLWLIHILRQKHFCLLLTVCCIWMCLIVFTCWIVLPWGTETVVPLTHLNVL